MPPDENLDAKRPPKTLRDTKDPNSIRKATHSAIASPRHVKSCPFSPAKALGILRIYNNRYIPLVKYIGNVLVAHSIILT